MHTDSQTHSGGRKQIASVPVIPDKLYFKIGEVSEITGVEPHVLRYWESEIKVIRPQRASSKQRLYRKVDVENIITIKRLLHEDGYTIPGARKFLADRKKQKKLEKKTSPKKITAKKTPSKAPEDSIVKEIKSGLGDILNLLEKNL